MSRYNKIKVIGSKKSRSIDFSDLFSLPISKTEKPNIIINTIDSIPVDGGDYEDGKGDTKKSDSVKLKRVSSVSSTSTSLQSAMKRAFSMKRCSSASDGYCRIHDQPLKLAQKDSALDGDDDDEIEDSRSVKKKHKKGKIIKACKRLFGRLKFLCSYGGKILPRPGDGYLRYVGGETRVVAVPRDIRFSDLMKKLAALFEGDVVFKYQLMPEDLDALVSVRTDEDLKHMIDEYDRHEDAGNSKLRTFLFPSKPVEIDSQVGGYTDAQAMEQRYIDAINGIARANTNTKLKYVNSNANKSLFSISSACSSPNSPSPDGNLDFNGYQNSQLLMHRVWSSPALNSLSNQTHHNIPQHHHNYYQNYHQHQHHHQYPQHGYPSPRLPQDLPKGSGPQRLLLPALSVDRAEINRAGINSGINNHLTASHRARGCGCGCRKPDGTNYYFPQSPQDGNVPQSPREGGSVPRTPREGSYPQSPRVDTQDCSPWGPREPNYM